jgi:hypothetical protein
MTATDLIAVLVGQQTLLREVHSALPDAPVVPHVAHREARLRRTRSATATALHRAAHRVAPAT